VSGEKTNNGPAETPPPTNEDSDLAKPEQLNFAILSLWPGTRWKECSGENCLYSQQAMLLQRAYFYKNHYK
jgi:hypothetical protein